MARDPHFRYVKSLLNFDSELAGVDPNAGALIGYADLTEKVQVELSAGGVTVVGAPYIGEVAGKSAMVINGSSAIYFTLGAGLNTAFTVELEVYIPAAAATAVSGVVTDSSNNPCERRVYAYSHADGRFLGDAVSDPVTGAFSIDVPERAFAVALDTDASGQNAIVLDRIDPV